MGGLIYAEKKNTVIILNTIFHINIHQTDLQDKTKMLKLCLGTMNWELSKIVFM